ncbi:hypothetical protein C2845_PM05G13070 [Panicum miliaceum]|uniref:AP2/ERF domain-containing protein n=1 Tax=Panicum miliaceum TaxID=4540 RepID=A0A3L6SXF0_PANMI|nr:hypothetical protein C2845_PM05G13070 [Panicum miliaceum]
MLTLPSRALMQASYSVSHITNKKHIVGGAVEECAAFTYGVVCAPELAVMSTSTQEAEQDWMPGDEAAAASPGARSSSSSRYKGVVPQPNGRWGAQIYERHARVWLGTFADEAAAARAYDVAALRFLGRGGAVNFPGPADAAEMAFLAARPKAEVVDMLRKHTYHDELRQALRSGGAGERALALVPRAPLFEKAVTPSDVGRLNRLVVPKLHAEKHFRRSTRAPTRRLPCCSPSRTSAAGSSQSYVLTRGWSRFVREKGIFAGDTVAFSQAAASSASGTDGEMDAKRRMFIECRKRKRKDDGGDDFCPDGGARVVRLFGANIAASAIGASCMC